MQFFIKTYLLIVSAHYLLIRTRRTIGTLYTKLKKAFVIWTNDLDNAAIL